MDTHVCAHVFAIRACIHIDACLHVRMYICEYIGVYVVYEYVYIIKVYTWYNPGGLLLHIAPCSFELVLLPNRIYIGCMYISL